MQNKYARTCAYDRLIESTPGSVRFVLAQEKALALKNKTAALAEARGWLEKWLSLAGKDPRTALKAAYPASHGVPGLGGSPYVVFGKDGVETLAKTMARLKSQDASFISAESAKFKKMIGGPAPLRSLMSDPSSILRPNGILRNLPSDPNGLATDFRNSPNEKLLSFIKKLLKDWLDLAGHNPARHHRLILNPSWEEEFSMGGLDISYAPAGKEHPTEVTIAQTMRGYVNKDANYLEDQKERLVMLITTYKEWFTEPAADAVKKSTSPELEMTANTTGEDDDQAITALSVITSADAQIHLTGLFGMADAYELTEIAKALDDAKEKSKTGKVTVLDLRKALQGRQLIKDNRIDYIIDTILKNKGNIRNVTTKTLWKQISKDYKATKQLTDNLGDAKYLKNFARLASSLAWALGIGAVVLIFNDIATKASDGYYETVPDQKVIDIANAISTTLVYPQIASLFGPLAPFVFIIAGSVSAMTSIADALVRKEISELALYHDKLSRWFDSLKPRTTENKLNVWKEKDYEVYSRFEFLFNVLSLRNGFPIQPMGTFKYRMTELAKPPSTRPEWATDMLKTNPWLADHKSDLFVLFREFALLKIRQVTGAEK